jgi:lipoate---protein ligase
MDMKTKWRLLQHGARSAYENMALDEAILRCVTAETSPYTLRFYRWQPSAVSVGYFQSVEQEVDREACAAQGVDVIRRLTGGGAVYHDFDGEITYSLSIPDNYPGMPRKVLDSYGVLCSALVVGFQALGVPAEFKPINDILVRGKKISGNAQTRRFGGILQHGTLLCEVDPHRMFTLLKVPNEKIRDKLIAGVEERVTSIGREMGEVDRERVTAAMVAGFAQVLDIELEAGELTTEELALAEKLRKERYESDAWTFKR